MTSAAGTSEERPGARDRGLVALARSRHGDGRMLDESIAATGYGIVDVVIRRSVVDELDDVDADIVVIDSTLGDFDVRRLCRDIRRSLCCRILVLAAAGQAIDESWTVGVIEAGADDVISGGATPALLRSHLLALMRLAPAREPRGNDVVVGDVVVDVDGYSVFVAGRLVRFPSLQFKLLVALARRPNSVVSFGQLLSEVWGVEPKSVNPRRVRVAASILRRLLGEGAGRPRVETVSRVGYRLVVPPSVP